MSARRVEGRAWLALLLLPALLLACTRQQVYESAREMRIQECEKTLTGPERDACVARERGEEVWRHPQ